MRQRGWTYNRATTHILAKVGLADEELRAQVIFSNHVMVCQSDGADSREDKVLCDLVGEGFDGDKQNVGVANAAHVSTCQVLVATTVHAPVLSFEAPQADLAVVEGNLICWMSALVQTPKGRTDLLRRFLPAL
jgi:hypothetical protein